MNAAAECANQHMVDAFIADGALWSPALIAAFRATPRHCFLDRVFLYQTRQQRWREVLTRDPGPEDVPIVYSDRALITHLSPPHPGQSQVAISSSSQPSLMALMLEDLRLTAGQRVLEVGAGTGYNAALMAHVVGPGGVTSVDVDRSVLSEAWDHLRAFAERGVQLHHADGRHGYSEAAPYDRIVVTAATPDLEPAWLEQLAPGGILLAPLTLAPGLAYVVRGTMTQGIFEGRLLRTAYFMPLRSEAETGRETDDAAPPPGQPRAEPAPWAFCFARRRGRHGWLRFIQSAAFYAWLRGLEIHYTSQDHGAAFGISDGSACCWLGPTEWLVRDPADRALGDQLWQAFRDAGAPWPTEFRVRAGSGAAPERSGAREEFERRGPRCNQLWTLIEPRDRPASP